MIGWLASSIVMFGLSYLWHGVFLNDYELIQYPKGIFISASAIVYLFIGLLLSRIFIADFLDKISRHPLLRGPAAGFAAGIMVYLIALVIGVTYNKGLDMKYIVMDVVWQGVEQAIGGLFVGLSYMFIFEPFIRHDIPEGTDEEQ